MAKPGWIKLYYSLLENPMWEEEKPFTKAQAWIDLLLLAANWSHNVDGAAWEPGTVHLSKAFLMKRWGWSRRRIDNCLDEWERQNMVERSFERSFERRSGTVLTIVKWGFFQGSKAKSERRNERSFEQQPKNIYKNSAECGAKSPRPRARKKPPDGGGVQLVKNEQGEWVAVKK